MGGVAKARDHDCQPGLYLKTQTEDCTQSRSADQPVSLLPVWEHLVRTEAQTWLIDCQRESVCVY